MSQILEKVDFWICATPYDEVSDFRNSSEEALEYITSSTPLFKKKELLKLKDGCYIANMCSYEEALGLTDLLEEVEDVQFALFPKNINMMPCIKYTRREPNKIAKDLHKVIR